IHEPCRGEGVFKGSWRFAGDATYSGWVGKGELNGVYEWRRVVRAIRILARNKRLLIHNAPQFKASHLMAFSSRSGTSIHLRFPTIAEAAVSAGRSLLRLSSG